MQEDDDTMDKLRALRASTYMSCHQKINAQPESNSADAMMVGMRWQVIKLLDEVCGLVQIDILKKCINTEILKQKMT